VPLPGRCANAELTLDVNHKPYRLAIDACTTLLDALCEHIGFQRAGTKGYGT
jgi:hypothetical protein